MLGPNFNIRQWNIFIFLKFALYHFPSNLTSLSEDWPGASTPLWADSPLGSLLCCLRMPPFVGSWHCHNNCWQGAVIKNWKLGRIQERELVPCCPWALLEGRRYFSLPIKPENEGQYRRGTYLDRIYSQCLLHLEPSFSGCFQLGTISFIQHFKQRTK